MNALGRPALDGHLDGHLDGIWTGKKITDGRTFLLDYFRGKKKPEKNLVLASTDAFGAWTHSWHRRTR